MLETLRNATKTWMAQLFIGLLILSFAVWGIADIFSGGPGQAVAEVGDVQIPAPDYQREFQRELQRLSQQVGQPLTADQARLLGVDQQVLQRMVMGAVVDDKAQKLGLTVSEQTLVRDIRANEAFHGPFGRFDRATFEQVLYQNSLTEDAFIAENRKSMQRSQLLGAVTAAAWAPEGLAEAAYIHRNEQRAADYMLLTPELAGDLGAPTEEELAALHQENAERYTTPEYRAVTLLRIGPEDLAKEVGVSEEQLRDAYEARLDNYTRPEKRNILQIAFESMEEAEQAAREIAEGKEFMEVAREKGLSEEDVTLGLVARDELIAEEVAEVAFALEEGEVSAPVESPLGTVLLKVTAIEPAETQSFNAVKEALRKQLAIERATDEVFEFSNQIEDERAGGATLDEIAEKFGLQLHTAEAIDRSGNSPGGEPWEALPEDESVLAAIYDTEPGMDTDLIETEDGSIVWYRVDSITPSRLKPLEEVRDEVEGQWRTEKIREKLEQLAQDIVARGNGGESFKSLAEEFGKAVLSMPNPVPRWFSNDTFSNQAIENMFAVRRGGFTYGPVAVGDSLVVLKVSKVVRPDPAESPAQMAELEKRFNAAFAGDLLQQYLVGLREDSEVRINQQALQFLFAS